MTEQYTHTQKTSGDAQPEVFCIGAGQSHMIDAFHILYGTDEYRRYEHSEILQ